MRGCVNAAHQGEYGARDHHNLVVVRVFVFQLVLRVDGFALRIGDAAKHLPEPRITLSASLESLTFGEKHAKTTELVRFA